MNYTCQKIDHQIYPITHFIENQKEIQLCCAQCIVNSEFPKEKFIPILKLKEMNQKIIDQITNYQIEHQFQQQTLFLKNVMSNFERFFQNQIDYLYQKISQFQQNISLLNQPISYFLNNKEELIKVLNIQFLIKKDIEIIESKIIPLENKLKQIQKELQNYQLQENIENIEKQIIQTNDQLQINSNSIKIENNKFNLKGNYEGGEQNGVPHGYGTMDFEDGKFYDGYWKEGLFEGEGQLIIYNENLTYSGQFKEGKFSGKGKLTIEDIYLYEGQFNSGKKSGDGILIDKLNNQTYIGKFQNDQKQGQGTIKGNNYMFQGQFMEDKMDGQGTETFITEIDNEIQNLNQSIRTFKKAMGEQDKIEEKIMYIGNWSNGMKEGEFKKKIYRNNQLIENYNCIFNRNECLQETKA